MLNAAELTALAEGRDGIRVSLFMPTSRGGVETTGNRIRLKNLLRHTARALAADGASAPEVEAVLRPIRQYADDLLRWSYPSQGLALFLGPGMFRQHHVPLRMPHLAAVGDRFLVRPLLPLLGTNARFFVLTLNYDELRLCEGGPTGLREVTPEGMQLGVWQTMPRRLRRVDAFVADPVGPDRRAALYGHSDEDDERLFQHFRRVDGSLRSIIGDDAVLVLCGARHLQALYRKANTHRHLVERGVDGNIRDMTPDLLHRRAWRFAEPVLRRRETSAAAKHRALSGTGWTINGLAAVRDAAQQGLVEALFLSVESPGWHPAPGSAPVVHVAAGADGDLLDRAAAHTLCRGGQVYAVPAVRMPSQDPVAATLRH